jgi:hypothetical protein
MTAALRGGAEPGKKNIFQKYLGELATAGIKDPRNKLRLLKNFQSDVNQKVEEVKGDWYNKQQTMMLLLQSAQTKLAETNESFRAGIVNEQQLKDAQREAEKHEAEMLKINAEIAKLNRTTGPKGPGDPDRGPLGDKYTATEKAILRNIQDAILAGDDLLTAYNALPDQMRTDKSRKQVYDLWDGFQSNYDEEMQELILWGAPPEESADAGDTEVEPKKGFWSRLFGPSGIEVPSEGKLSPADLQARTKAFWEKGL